MKMMEDEDLLAELTAAVQDYVKVMRSIYKRAYSGEQLVKFAFKYIREGLRHGHGMGFAIQMLEDMTWRLDRPQ